MKAPSSACRCMHLPEGAELADSRAETPGLQSQGRSPQERCEKWPPTRMKVQNAELMSVRLWRENGVEHGKMPLETTRRVSLV